MSIAREPATTMSTPKESSMTDEPQVPPSPFALAPSAPPPSVHVKPAPVRVPPPGFVGSLPLSAEASAPRGVSVVEAEAEPHASARAVVTAVTPSRSQRTRPIVAFAAGGLAVMLCTSIVALRLVASKEETAATPTAFQRAPTVAPATGAVPAPDPPPAETASASPPARFDEVAARREIEDSAKRLAPCKLPKGAPFRVRVTFATDGTISTVTPLSPVSARQSACIASTIKTANAPAFAGRPVTKIYTVAAPR